MNPTPATSSGLEAIETASRDELTALQLERLCNTLHHAYEHVALYRNKFEQAGIHPDDIKSLEDLTRLPVTTKEDLRDQYPFGMFAVPMEQVVRVHASSGTTGKPTVVGYSQADVDLWALVMARSIYAAGGRAQDKVHVSYGYGLFTGGIGAHYGAERLGCTVIPMSGGQTEKQVQLIRELVPEIIMVSPSYILNIADEFERQGVDPATSSLRVGLLGAEPWTEGMRAEIEGRLGIDALDLFGLSEVIGPGVAQECLETKDGLTLWEDHFYPEIIDPTSGAVLADGEPGELVLTSLTKEAMPIIRYRTRDLTRLLPGTARTMRRMEKITGRNDDMLIIRGVNVFPSQIEALVLEQPGLSPHYFLEVYQEGRLDTMDVLVELKPGATNTNRGQEAAALQQRIKDLVGVNTTVRVVDQGAIERSQGKARRVNDTRNKS
jgi:phenylacetate-CoA ligase